MTKSLFHHKALNKYMFLYVMFMFLGLRPGASRQFAAGGPGHTGTNREGIRVRSYIPIFI